MVRFVIDLVGRISFGNLPDWEYDHRGYVWSGKSLSCILLVREMPVGEGSFRKMSVGFCLVGEVSVKEVYAPRQFD